MSCVSKMSLTPSGIPCSAPRAPTATPSSSRARASTASGSTCTHARTDRSPCLDPLEAFPSDRLDGRAAAREPVRELHDGGYRRRRGCPGGDTAANRAPDRLLAERRRGRTVGIAEEREDLRVIAARQSGVGGVPQRSHCVPDLVWRAGIGCGLHEEPHVLGHQAGREAGVERAGEHAPHVLVGRCVAPSGGDVDDVEDRLQLEPVGEPEQHGLTRGRRGGRREEVVEQLQRLPLSRLGADVEDVPRHRLERRAMSLEHVGRPRPHHGDGRLHRAAATAGDRCVDVGEAHRACLRERPLRDPDADGGEVDDGRDGAIGRLAQLGEHVDHGVAVGKAEEDRVGPRREVGERGRRVGTGRCPLRAAGGVEHDHFHSRAGEVRRHRPAHVAETDEAVPRGGGHVASSGSMPCSCNTSRASRNASTPAGMPQ